MLFQLHKFNFAVQGCAFRKYLDFHLDYESKLEIHFDPRRSPYRFFLQICIFFQKWCAAIEIFSLAPKMYLRPWLMCSSRRAKEDKNNLWTIGKERSHIHNASRRRASSVLSRNIYSISTISRGYIHMQFDKSMIFACCIIITSNNAFTSSMPVLYNLVMVGNFFQSDTQTLKLKAWKQLASEEGMWS